MLLASIQEQPVARGYRGQKMICDLHFALKLTDKEFLCPCRLIIFKKKNNFLFTYSPFVFFFSRMNNGIIYKVGKSL